jgi:hypothetical protein
VAQQAKLVNQAANFIECQLEVGGHDIPLINKRGYCVLRILKLLCKFIALLFR